MGVSYAGISTFTLQRREPKGSAGDVPGVTETWRGRADERDAFFNQFPLGTAYGGGYVTERDARDDGMYGIVELTIALEPDFQKDWPSNSTSIKSATKTAASIDIQNVVFDENGQSVSPVKAERTVVFYAPETRHSYFASSKPSGPRYKNVATAAKPVILRSVIKASAATGGASGNAQEVVFSGATAPAGLVSALTMPEVETVTGHDAQPILGTAWYRCTDTVTRELQGDSSS